MTIDDELILALLEPQKDGKVGEKALIVKVVKTRRIEYKLEEPTCYEQFYFDKNRVHILQREIVKIAPDITVTLLEGDRKQIAIELENDIRWDFQESLRQVKKYKQERAFLDARVIIPKEYEKFAPLYMNEGFRVYLWEATRRWQCLRCGTETTKEGPVTPICSKTECGNHSPNEFRLVGLKDADIKEFE